MTIKHPMLTLAALFCAGTLALTACGKKEGGDKKSDDPAQNSMEPEAMGALMAARPAPQRPRPRPLVWTSMSLPKTKLKIQVPQGTKIEEGILPNSDWVKFPGGRHSFVVRKWQHGDKTLDKQMAWARKHQIQKHQGDVLKQGSGKHYTYIYKVVMGGRPGAVFVQYKDVGGQTLRCFSNARSVGAAKLFHKACSSLSK